LDKFPDKARQTVILFVDAMHLVHNTLPGKAYMKKGTLKRFKTNSGQKRLNIIGSLERGTNKIITQVSQTNCNATRFINFIRKLERHYSDKTRIILILDNARAHHAKLVREFIKNSPVKLWYLPAYSPNLNLIERLWKFTKDRLLKNHYYETFKIFQRTTRNFFNRIDKHKPELETLLTESFTILKFE